MACDLTIGRLFSCKDSVGGLKAIYFISYEDSGLEVTYDVTDTDVIDSLGTAVAAFRYDLKGASTYSEAITSSAANGTTAFDQTLAVTFTKLTKEDHKEIKLLCYGRPHVIVETNNGDLFYAGNQHGMDVTGGTIVSGAALSELVGYTLTLTGSEKVPANFCVAAGSTIAAQLTALGVSVTVGV